MNSRTPPRLAAWLLRRTGVAANEPLAGDLLEEFRNGRSAGWYWRQTGVAVLNGFARGLRAERLDIVAWTLGWCLETAVVIIALRLFPLIRGLDFAWRAAGLFAVVALVIYLDYRVHLHHWFNECDMADEESENFWGRWIATRLRVLGSFGVYIIADLIAYGWGLLCDGADRIMHIQPSSWSLTSVIVVHVIWIATNVVQMAMKAAGPKSQNG